MNKLARCFIALCSPVLLSLSAQPVFADSADAAFPAATEQQMWRFKVSLDKREIGFHDFLVRYSAHRRDQC